MLNRHKNYKIALLHGFAVFNPKGFIASEQKELIITAVLLMLIAVIPAVFLTFFFAWKYRANRKEKYTPSVDGNKNLQFAWFGLLVAIILAIAVMTWRSTHILDPRRPIESENKPITIQVVALQWKWLFIYPEQNIATINHIQFPEDTPINFEITADAPMNSFWIPQLGGQMYAMNGMKTTLHLIADERGTYSGFSSNISGEGFSGMKFSVKASSAADFYDWVKAVKQSKKNLTDDEYMRIAQPSSNNAEETYASADPILFDSIIHKFMATPSSTGHMTH